MTKSLLAFMLFAALAARPALAQASTESAAAVAAMVANATAQGRTDIENPTCRVIEAYAQCGYGSGGGNAHVNVIERQQGGSWSVVAHYAGAATAHELNSLYGVPMAVAVQFAPPAAASGAYDCARPSKDCSAVLNAEARLNGGTADAFAANIAGRFAAVYLTAHGTEFLGIYEKGNGAWTKMRCSWYGIPDDPSLSAKERYSAAARACGIAAQTSSLLAPRGAAQ